MRVSLILAATPLGNPGDASARLIAALTSADVIAAEDSRRFHRLATDLGVTFTARVLSFFEGNDRFIRSLTNRIVSSPCC
jgi:16S rRNA (cytidine1402-2'-O)-methyltransferase